MSVQHRATVSKSHVNYKLERRSWEKGLSRFNVSSARVGFLQLRVTASPALSTLLSSSSRSCPLSGANDTMVTLVFTVVLGCRFPSCSALFWPCCELSAWFFFISHLLSYRIQLIIIFYNKSHQASNSHSFSTSIYYCHVCGLAKWWLLCQRTSWKLNHMPAFFSHCMPDPCLAAAFFRALSSLAHNLRTLSP